MMNRRRFLTGLLAMPLVIRTPGLLMPVKAAGPLAVSRIRTVPDSVSVENLWLETRSFGRDWELQFAVQRNPAGMWRWVAPPEAQIPAGPYRIMEITIPPWGGAPSGVVRDAAGNVWHSPLNFSEGMAEGAPILIQS